ncbi:MAG TPA: hypothetical protein VEY30_10600, partial [Myxococcaceae bacterium]|nr:hypothetical protein [Myxococcaceae bacterium]
RPLHPSIRREQTGPDQVGEQGQRLDTRPFGEVVVPRAVDGQGELIEMAPENPEQKSERPVGQEFIAGEVDSRDGTLQLQ